MKIGKLTDSDKYAAKKAADDYFAAKKTKPINAVRGFIEKNAIIGKTTKEIDALVKSAKRLHGGTLFGSGDKFKSWCERMGRDIPSDDLVRFMNADPFGAREEIKRCIPTNIKMWRSYCSYLAGRGR